MVVTKAHQESFISSKIDQNWSQKINQRKKEKGECHLPNISCVYMMLCVYRLCLKEYYMAVLQLITWL